ncbi:hypothetical protein D8S78_10590 [Natrialba swarupiae]|nr:hypothetical protein [Natrialba swarupiae]
MRRGATGPLRSRSGQCYCSRSSSALALYQVNAVPAENEVVEIEHNQEIHDEMQDLRNAVRAVGAGGGSQPTTVTLGTQYPTRTLTANPPPPAGTLETSEAGSLEIENAEVSERVGEYDESQLEALVLGTHDTRTLSYEPGYNEYRARRRHGSNTPSRSTTSGMRLSSCRGRPATRRRRLDHGRLTRGEPLGDVDRLGDRRSRRRRADGSGSDRVRRWTDHDHAPDGDPAAWNETFADESDVTVDSYDETAGALTIELDGDEYDLQVSRVAVGDGDPGSEFGGSRTEPRRLAATKPCRALESAQQSTTRSKRGRRDGHSRTRQSRRSE